MQQEKQAISDKMQYVIGAIISVVLAFLYLAFSEPRGQSDEAQERTGAAVRELPQQPAQVPVANGVIDISAVDGTVDGKAPVTKVPDETGQQIESVATETVPE